MTPPEGLLARLDGAQYVRYVRPGYVLVWSGGHGLHVFTTTGFEVECLTVGDFAERDAARDEVEAAATSWSEARG